MDPASLIHHFYDSDNTFLLPSLKHLGQTVVSAMQLLN